MAQPRPAIAWGAVIAVIGALISWPFFLGGRLSAVETKAADLDKRTARVEQAIDSNAEYYRSIDQRLSRIEGKLGVGEAK